MANPFILFLLLLLFLCFWSLSLPAVELVQEFALTAEQCIVGVLLQGGQRRSLWASEASVGVTMGAAVDEAEAAPPPGVRVLLSQVSLAPVSGRSQLAEEGPAAEEGG
ncbi:hypothetical protein EYF80_043352 [Liparis tanakae]|uniref:Uncharacterized protein n=1 Tax=Liparis tanakae TaxID=230148 RepID=A0A4Z2FYQ5_9TELE|nr:hypothetical protein EYF80_043352 [Liparis tanakae]